MIVPAPPLKVAAVQLALGYDDQAANIAAVCALVEEAAGKGAKIVLPPELFSGPYFCREEADRFFDLAHPLAEHPSVRAMQELARGLNVAIPTSFFERDGPHYYNTLAMVDAGGKILGTYRKSHIPDGPGYEEKYYFRPGNSGFKVWDIDLGNGAGTRIGVGICWDQWYPESARVMALMGAELLFYPTAIGSEPQDATFDTSRMWRRAMVGHAVANCMPVIAANRIGTEPAGQDGGQTFYGHSFITNEWGDLVGDMGSAETGIVVAELDLAAARRHRASMGFFRDRRPQLYTRICEDI